MTSPGVQGEVNSLHGRILEKDSATFNGKKNLPLLYLFLSP